MTDRKIKEYDFRSPKHYTREQLRLVFSMYESYARMLSSYISGSLQIFSQVEIVEAEEKQYFDFHNMLPDSVLIGIVDFATEEVDTEENPVLLDISKNIGFCVIDRLLGGSGKPLDKDRDFTEIETGILEHFIKGMVNIMKNVWFDYMDVSPRLMKLETSPSVLQRIGTDDNLVIIQMKVMVNDTEGYMQICIPTEIMDVLFKKKNSRMKKNIRGGDKNAEAKRKEDIISEISKTELEITGILGSVDVVLQELMDLKVGDIIVLDKPVNSYIDLVVENSTWFRGELGVSNRKKACIIKESLEKGEAL